MSIYRRRLTLFIFSQAMQNSDDSSIMLSQFAYDPWEGLTQRCNEIMDKNQTSEPQAPREKRVRRKPEPVRKAQKLTESYVISRERIRGIRLIKISVCDLRSEPPASFVQESGGTVDEDSVVLSAQYVVTDSVDEIMDLTETVIRKITKKLCSDNF